MKKLVLNRKNGSFFLVLIIFGIAFLFRFYKIQDWFFWGMDQEYEAFLAKNIVTLKHFPLIGVNASDTGLYLGPAFIYFASIFFAIFAGNPLGWAIVASSVGIFTTYLIYKVGKQMFSEITGIFASFLYAGSFLTSFYDRQFWNPTPVPLFSLIIGFLLYKILNGHKQLIFWLALVFGLAIQSHLSILIFIPLIIFVIWKKHKIFSKKLIFISIIIFFLTQLPIIIFDLKHNLINTKAVLNLVTNPQANTINLSSWQQRNVTFISSLGRIFWVPPPVDLFVESGVCNELSGYKRQTYLEGIIFIFVGILIFLFWSILKQKNPHKEVIQKFSNSSLIIIGVFIPTLIFVEFYSRSFFEYYLLYLFPWLSLTVGKSMELIWQRRHGYLVVMPVLLAFIMFNTITLFSSFSSYSYLEKLTAIDFAKNYLQNDKYSLEALGECPRFGGYRYLFERFHTTPVHSYMDSYFAWLYPETIKTDPKEQIVLLSMIDHRMSTGLIGKWEKIKLQYILNYDLVTQARFDKIHVLILSRK